MCTFVGSPVRYHTDVLDQDLTEKPLRSHTYTVVTKKVRSDSWDQRCERQQRLTLHTTHTISWARINARTHTWPVQSVWTKPAAALRVPQCDCVKGVHLPQGSGRWAATAANAATRTTKRSISSTEQKSLQSLGKTGKKVEVVMVMDGARPFPVLSLAPHRSFSWVARGCLACHGCQTAKWTDQCSTSTGWWSFSILVHHGPPPHGDILLYILGMSAKRLSD